MARTVPKNNRLRKVRIHPRGGDLACFFAFSKVSRTPEMFRGCAMYQLLLRSRDKVCDLLPFKRCSEGQGVCGHFYLHIERGGSCPPVYTTAVIGRQRERSSKTEHRTNRKKRGGRGGKKSGWGGFVKIVGVLIWRLNGSHISDQNEWCT